MRPIIRELISYITVSGNSKDCKKLVEVQNIRARVRFFFFQKEASFGKNKGGIDLIMIPKAFFTG
jgi:hypothetical protein